MINLIFGWINFLVTILIGGYAYLRWFKKPIKSAIALQKTQKQDLEIELSALQNQIKVVSLDLVFQAEQAAQLLSKVEAWQQAYFAKEQLYYTQVKTIQEQVDLKNQIKLQNLNLILAQKMLFRSTFTQATDTLKDNFSNQQLAAEFLEQICDKLD